MFKRLAGKKLWVSLLLVVFFAIAIGVIIQTGTAAEKVGPVIGNKTPNFTLDSLTSKNVALYPVIKENKVTLINFWGMWCPYCVQEIPEFVKFYKQYHQRQVEILAVNVGDNPKEVPLFVKNNQMVFPVLIDKNNAVSTLYQIAGYPTTFIVDRQGKIKDMIVGGTNQATLAAKVEKVLREK
jgi:peroxiredoxin